MVGGIEPAVGSKFAGTLSLDLTGLNQILEIDKTSRAARMQGGIRCPDIENGLRPHGLTMRHFPQSFDLATLGGMIATRSGGHFATLYTHIDDFCGGHSHDDAGRRNRKPPPSGIWCRT